MAFVTTCPSNLNEQILASNRLGCDNDTYGHNQYICAPNEAKTSLVEICNDGIMGIVDKGNCLSVAGTKYETVSCLNFSSGCPIHHYWSYEFYIHSTCQMINTNLQCYEMDPACQLQVPDEVTETRTIMIVGWTIAAALLVAVVLICVFCTQVGGATCAARMNRLRGGDVMSDTENELPEIYVHIDIIPEDKELSEIDCKIGVIPGDKELSEIDCKIDIIPEDIGPPENEELALGDRCTIKVEGQAREQT